MKGIRTFLICVVILAFVAFCVAIFALPSVTLYDAKSDAYSYDQMDPSIKDLKYTESGEQLFALMDRQDIIFGEIAVAIRNIDPVYLNETIAKFNSTYTTYGNTLKTLYTPKSNLDSYYQLAYRVNASGTNLSNCYARFALLLNDLEFKDDIHPDFISNNLDHIELLDTVHNQEIHAELVNLSEKIMPEITVLYNTAHDMANIVEKFGLSTAELNSVGSLLTEFILMLSPFLGENTWQNIWQNVWQSLHTIDIESNRDDLQTVPKEDNNENNKNFWQDVVGIDVNSSWSGTQTHPIEENNETIIMDSEIRTTEETKKESLLFYGFVLFAILGAGGVLIWRNILKRKVLNSDKVVKSANSSLYVESAAQNNDYIDDAFAKAEPNTQLPVPIYPQGIDSTEDIREIYRCVIHAVADISGLDHVDVLTPFEVVRESGIVQLMPFIEQYVYMQYGSPSVSSDDLRKLKEMAKNIANVIKKRES